MKAAAQEQRRLLELQRHETESAKVAAAIKSSPAAVRVDELALTIQAAKAALVRLRTEADDLTREIRRAEQDLDRLQQRKQRDEQMMNSGANAKVQRELAHEAQALERRISDAEDAELDLLEQQEKVNAKISQAEEEILNSETAMTVAQTERRDELTELRRTAEFQRQSLAELEKGVPAELLAAYERSHNAMGIAAAEFVNGRCLGCRLSIPSVEAAAIEAAAADEVMWCDECGCILVRGTEGLDAL